LALNVFSWVWAVGVGKRVGIYCSDVSGAFDRVNAASLIRKLRAKGVHKSLLAVLASWLDTRNARVCVDGVFSQDVPLSNMVFQGTVLGPPLWNCYYEDAHKAVLEALFLDTVFADDLNCFRVFDACYGDKFVIRKIK
jgi:hypothetical protein